MTPRSRRNNRISRACGIESILIESFFPGFPENLSDPNNRISSACGIESILIESFFPGFPENLSDPLNAR